MHETEDKNTESQSVLNESLEQEPVRQTRETQAVHHQTNQGTETVYNQANPGEQTIHNQTTIQETNGMAIAALILGVGSVFLSWFPLLPYITAILAIVFGAIGMKVKVHKVFAIIGIILGIVTFLIKIGFWIVLIFGIVSDLT